MTTISPDRIVDDWGSFERLVAKLHETGSVTVQNNVKLKGQSGAIRQIDVLIKHTQGLGAAKIIVDVDLARTFEQVFYKISIFYSLPQLPRWPTMAYERRD